MSPPATAELCRTPADLIAWRTTRKPPTQADVASWVQQAAHSPAAQHNSTQPGSAAARAAEGVARLINVPHKPALPRHSGSAKWSTFVAGAAPPAAAPAPAQQQASTQLVLPPPLALPATLALPAQPQPWPAAGPQVGGAIVGAQQVAGGQINSARPSGGNTAQHSGDSRGPAHRGNDDILSLLGQPSSGTSGAADSGGAARVSAPTLLQPAAGAEPQSMAQRPAERGGGVTAQPAQPSQGSQWPSKRSQQPQQQQQQQQQPHQQHGRELHFRPPPRQLDAHGEPQPSATGPFLLGGQQPSWLSQPAPPHPHAPIQQQQQQQQQQPAQSLQAAQVFQPPAFQPQCHGQRSQSQQLQERRFQPPAPQTQPAAPSHHSAAAHPSLQQQQHQGRDSQPPHNQQSGPAAHQPLFPGPGPQPPQWQQQYGEPCPSDSWDHPSASQPHTGLTLPAGFAWPAWQPNVSGAALPAAAQQAAPVQQAPAAEGSQGARQALSNAAGAAAMPGPSSVSFQAAAPTVAAGPSGASFPAMAAGTAVPEPAGLPRAPTAAAYKASSETTAEAAGKTTAAAPGTERKKKAKTAAPTKQAVLLSAGRYAAPPPEEKASAWHKPSALQVLNSDPKPKPKAKKKPAGQASSGAAGSAGTGTASKSASKGATGSKAGKAAAAAVAAGGSSGGAAGGAASALRELWEGGSDDDDFELMEVAAGEALLAPKAAGRMKSSGGGAAEGTPGQPGTAGKGAGRKGRAKQGAGMTPQAGEQPPQQQHGQQAEQQPQSRLSLQGAKKPRQAKPAAAPSGGGKAAGAAGSGAAAAGGAEQLDFLGARAVEACSSLGFQRFAAEMGGAEQCSVGLLLADSSGAQFCSSLESLSKEQVKAIKAAAEGGKPKKKRKKSAAASVATDANEPAEASGAAGAVAATPTEGTAAQAAAARPLQPVALCLLPIHLEEESGTSRLGETMYYLPLVPGTWGGAAPVSEDMAARGRQTVEQLLSNSQAILCFGMQGVLASLLRLGVRMPPPHHLSLIDPQLLGWLLEPQLVHGSERELEEYGLKELLARHCPGAAGTASTALGQGPGQAATAAGRGPLCRLRAALAGATRLGEELHGRLVPAVPMEAIQREMQVAAMLAEMEVAGLGFDPWLLGEQGEAARGLMRSIEERAAQLAGRPFNLSSPSQLAEVLYTTLGLPPPTAHGRGAAKTHLPTDEAALNQLRSWSELPGLVLEYRALQNFLSKFVDADWVRAARGGAPSAAARLAAAGDWPRVHCCWNQTATATGRLSSSAPNLQAVTKYRMEPLGQGQPLTVRHAFVAAKGCVLLSADYSQIELRVLAHLSGDPRLLRLLRQAGAAGDAFKLIAATWLAGGGAAPLAAVSEEQREKAKRVCYAILYGTTAWGLAQGPAALGISVPAAKALIDSFLDHFSGVRAYLEQVKRAARAEGCVRTLAGRVRHIKGLASSDKRVRAEAERKAVNTTVQGSAADIMKAAMVAWAEWQEAQGQPPVRLVAQIHDELMLEIDVRQAGVERIAEALRGVMEGVVPLSVPLVANIKAGERWGAMTPLPAAAAPAAATTAAGTAAAASGAVPAAATGSTAAAAAADAGVVWPASCASSTAAMARAAGRAVAAAAPPVGWPGSGAAAAAGMAAASYSMIG